MNLSFDIRQRASRARRLLSARDYEGAVRELEEALERYPGEVELLALAADCQRKMKRLSEAATYLKRAEASNPAHEMVLSVGADLAFDGKDFERAAALYRQLIDWRPNRYHFSRRVLALNRLGRYDEAAETARQGLERFPEDPWLLRGLAAAESKRGRSEEAGRLYQRLVEIDPGDRFAYKELMRLRTADAPAEEAASALKGLMRGGDRGQNPHLKTLRADRLRRAGKLREAVEEYKAALELEPGNAYALSQLGFSYRKLGDNEQAFITLSRALLADPTNMYVRRTLESMGRSANRCAELLELVDEALRLHPDVKSLYGMRKKLLRMAKAPPAPPREPTS